MPDDYYPNPTIPNRQFCDWCHEVCRIDFAVPNEMWDEVMATPNRIGRVCVNCFARRADEKMVRWCDSITLRPMSKRRHFDDVMKGSKDALQE